MRWIDERGRLLGRINLIDAIVGVALLGLLPLAYGAYLLFRTPTPTVATVQPREVVEKQDVNLRIAGENLRPYLRARFGTIESAGFLVQNPRAAEVKVPADLPPGTYDLTLSDESLDLVTVPAALTVISVLAMADVRIRFVAHREVADLMKAGDTDILDPKSSERRHATLIAAESVRQPVTGLITYESSGAGRIQVNQALVTFVGTVRTPVVKSPSGWMYRGRAVKTGAGFVFETQAGIMEGSVVSAAVDSRPAADAP